MREQGRKKMVQNTQSSWVNSVEEGGRGSEGQLRCKCAGQRWKLLYLF